MMTKRDVSTKLGIVVFMSILLYSPSLSQGDSLEQHQKALRSRSITSLMSLIANHQVEENPLREGEYLKGNWETVKKSKLPKAMYWSYTTGVTLLTMQRVYNITHDEALLKFIDGNSRIAANQYAYMCWQKSEFGTVYKTAGFEKLWRLEMLDDCGSMGAAILETKLRHHIEFTPQVSKLVDIIGNFVTNVQSRLSDGTYWRPESPDGQTIWADDLYMSLPFLIRWSEYTSNPSLLDDAARQIINYAARLQDHDGVWFHAYFVDKNTPSCCKWGRANGWVAVAIAEVLSVLPKDHPQYNTVLEICKKHLDGLIRYQSKTGLWNQVIDHPELTWGDETSCSAAFTYAIARGINKGWLERSTYLPVVTKALEGLKLEINEAGGIGKVCRSTSIGGDLTYYNERPTRDDDYHGNGLILFALTEMYALQGGK